MMSYLETIVAEITITTTDATVTDDEILAVGRALWPAFRGPRARSLDPVEALADNTGSRRSYWSPCSTQRGFETLRGTWGQHSPRWPRTKRSLAELEARRAEFVRIVRTVAAAMAAAD